MTHGLANKIVDEPPIEVQVPRHRSFLNDSHLIRVDALSHYEDLVRKLGGDPKVLLQRVGIEGDLGNTVEFVPYRKLVDLLHHTANALDRPDFGLVLALEQGGTAILGPLEVAMRNSPTLGDALTYYMSHSEVISSAVSMVLEKDAVSGRPYFRHEMYVRYPLHSQQVSEHAMAALHHGLIAFSDGKVRSREVWFSHGAISNPAYYRRYFGARVEMNMPYTALFIDEADLSTVLPNSARNLFEIADAYIDKECNNFRTFSSKVRSILIKRLPYETTTKEAVACKLNLHPKTLQRRLFEEGATFTTLRDQVRRDAALRYLTETRIPITRIAALLGYSETAVLSRSCRQWFGCAPSKVRRRSLKKLGKCVDSEQELLEDGQHVDVLYEHDIAIGSKGEESGLARNGIGVASLSEAELRIRHLEAQIAKLSEALSELLPLPPSVVKKTIDEVA